MTVPTHFRFTVRGDFVGTPEHWSFGFHMSRDVAGNPDAKISDIDQAQVTTAITTFWAGGGGQTPTDTKVTDWRAYQIGTDGLMEENPLVVDVSANNILGGVGPKYPPQIAACVTTVAANRGPARFGRFYLPTAAPIAADKRMSVVTATGIATAATQLLKDVSDAIDLVALTSAVGLNISASGLGAKQVINHLECGRVLDTLRNRRKSLLEERYVHTLIDW